MSSTLTTGPKASAIPAFAAEQHVLPNGFTVYLSPNPAEPRIYTEIAVRAGSKHDPDRSTGLAHYLEHMLFKGTDQIGSSNWEAEEPLLQEIAKTYEDHRNTSDAEERRRLYAKIDQLSQQAAKYALPGEYDRLIAQMGASHTNAYTWVDQTVFLNDIPSGELGRWMTLESERFSRLVLRLFHTELETVFEEFNISQDKDIRKVMRAANDALYSPHPYGTHTTIGKGEHLKAPSHYDIYDFFAKHYVPGNMTMVLAGDFDPKEALEWARKTFGHWESKPIPAYEAPVLDTVQGQTVEVFGQEAESAYLHWRIPGAGTPESIVAQLASGMLYNRQAGIFDEALLQTQAVLSASAGVTPMAEYGTFRCTVKPRPGQSLEQAVELVQAQIARLAAGDYPEWLRDAVLVDHEVTMNRSAEANQGRAGILTTAFLHRLELEDVLHRVHTLQQVTEQQIQAFAKTYLTPASCVTVFKRQGQDPTVLKVEKPEITPVPLQTEHFSGFAERLLTIEPNQIEARFAKLDEEIQQANLSDGVVLHHLDNDENGLFELLYVFDFGSRSDRWISFATKYLSYLGTSRRTNAEVQVDFYRLGLQWQVQASAHRIYLGVNGLDKHLPEALELLDELIRDCQPDEARWNTLVENTAQNRQNQRTDKQMVLRRAMNQYGRFGDKAPLANNPTLTELKAKKAVDLVASLHALAEKERAIFYYGPTEASKVKRLIHDKVHLPSETKSAEKPSVLPVLVPAADQVKFVNFPMVQVEILALRHVDTGFDAKAWIMAEWFNQYYGLGLSSVVFQELRESRALAYSTYAYSETPDRKDGNQFLQAFIGTQPDKLQTALDGMTSLLKDWKWDAGAAERVRSGMLQQMRTERDLRQSRYWLWRQGLDRGISTNQREWLYEGLEKATPADLEAYFKRLNNAPTTFLVLGNKEHLDMDTLTSFGAVEELSLDTVFGNNLS